VLIWYICPGIRNTPCTKKRYAEKYEFWRRVPLMINEGNLNLVSFLPFCILHLSLIRMKLSLATEVSGAISFKTNIYVFQDSQSFKDTLDKTANTYFMWFLLDSVQFSI